MIYQMIYLGKKATLREQFSSMIKGSICDLIDGSKEQLLLPNPYFLNPSNLSLKQLG
ncbi:hypothetical protein [Moorena producens]|uniref:hypothetical protein n=1 Tax=Moorena producens TaxID=1155739 RepID=UPI0013143CBB|nr:hypothetical protein [Moorena producens]